MHVTRYCVTFPFSSLVLMYSQFTSAVRCWRCRLFYCGSCLCVVRDSRFVLAADDDKRRNSMNQSVVKPKFLRQLTCIFTKGRHIWVTDQGSWRDLSGWHSFTGMERDLTSRFLLLICHRCGEEPLEVPVELRFLCKRNQTFAKNPDK